VKELLTKYAIMYNRPEYFETDPVIFPKKFAQLTQSGKASLQDVEIAAVIAAHLAWGRRDITVRNCNKAFDEMEWQPYRYIMEREWLSGAWCSGVLRCGLHGSGLLVFKSQWITASSYL
jgi:hypothetical protein